MSVRNVSASAPKSKKQLHDALSVKIKKTKLRSALDIGSDVEIAQQVVANLKAAFGECVFTEGDLWVWHDTHWVALPEYVISKAIHRYDGMCHSGDKVIRLSKQRIASVAHEAMGLMTHPEFFDHAPAGINCASGFIQFAKDGTPTLLPHAREQRQRHVLPGQWQPGTDGDPPPGSLLYTFLSGIFRGDVEEGSKLWLMQELMGSAACGYATKVRWPKAAVLWGPLADNGKSQFLDMCRGVLPTEAVVSITPSKVSDGYFVPRLAGKLLNASDEASSAEAIGSETFKAVVTGEPVSGRPIYGHPVELRSKAQNIFALNSLPNFKGGMDRGVRRRLLVVPFNRSIPREERIESIGVRVAEEEADLLLAWAVAGASRLIKQREFTEPEECKEALREWLLSTDPVEGWFADCVEIVAVDAATMTPQVRAREAFLAFRVWARMEGYKDVFVPGRRSFTERVSARKGVISRRKPEGTVFIGIRIRQSLETEIERLREAGMLEKWGIEARREYA